MLNEFNFTGTQTVGLQNQQFSQQQQQQHQAVGQQHHQQQVS